jgi:deazaflavin-dependent oxidoreductase (nitroreductase family)
MNEHGFFKRTLHQFLAWGPISKLMARVLHRADALLLRVSGGRLDFTSLSGLPVVELITTGARSGQPRSIPLAGFPVGDTFVLIASNFGGAHHPAWYHNLKATPACALRKNGETRAFVARECEGDERERYFQLAVSYYAGYQAYSQRAGERVIPVMVLEPRQ